MSQVGIRNKKSRQAVQNSKQSTGSGVAPIHSLPDDVLAIVFQLVHKFRPCAAGLACCGLHFPKRLVTLSHVCGRWRRLAIDSRTLWTHIDLTLGGRNWQRTLDRAEVYANRARDLPLHIKLAIWDSTLEWDQVSARVEKLLGSVAARVKHLDATTDSASGTMHKFQSQTLSALLEGCTPRILTKLTLRNRHSSHFVSSLEVAWSDTNWQLSIPHGRLESIWESISVLQTDGLFPYWTSKAYHNLVELDIQGSRERPMDLPEPQLVEIFKSSPGLRAIRLNISVVDALPSGIPVVPIALECLEVLTIESNDYERVVQWLAPGPAFLKLCVSRNSTRGDFIVHETIFELLRRSRKAGLQISRALIPSTEIAKALYRMPDLRTLDVTCCVVRHRRGCDSGLPPLEGYHLKFQPSCLLYLYGCDLDFDSPRWISEQNLAKRVVFARCEVTDDSMGFTDMVEANVRKQFSSCVGLEILDLGEELEFPAAWDWPDQWSEDRYS